MNSINTANRLIAFDQLPECIADLLRILIICQYHAPRTEGVPTKTPTIDRNMILDVHLHAESMSVQEHRRHGAARCAHPLTTTHDAHDACTTGGGFAAKRKALPTLET